MTDPQTPEAPAGATTKAPGRFRKAWDRVREFVRSRRPHKAIIIVVATGVAVLMGLGTWQVIRLHEKNAFITQIKTQMQAPLADLTQKWPQSTEEWAKKEYQPLVIQGQWLGLHAFKLIPRTYEGQVGYQWLVPLQLPDQQVVLVNRGFIPDGQAMLPPREGEKVQVQGVGWIPPEKKPWQTPENIPSRGLWTWLDMTALQHEIGVQKMAPFVLYELRNAESSDYPIGGQFPSPTHNRHAQYALTWYALALALLIIGFVASGPREEASGGGEDGKIADPVAERGMYPEATD